MPQPFVASLVGGLEPTFYTLLGAVGLVLLIACANVTSLFLGRLTARQQEIAVRQSLGATRGRVVRQFLVESLVFSTMAGALGCCWRSGRCRRSSRSSPPAAAGHRVTLNWRALLFTVGVTLVSARAGRAGAGAAGVAAAPG